MNSYKHIKEIRQDYDKGCYTGRTTVPEKLGENYIFDENLSVKQNRKLVQEHNLRIERLEKASKERSVKLSKKFQSDILHYIMHEYHLNKSQAELVETYVYSEGHGFGHEYFTHIDDIAAFAEVISRLCK